MAPLPRVHLIGCRQEVALVEFAEACAEIRAASLVCKCSFKLIEKCIDLTLNQGLNQLEAGHVDKHRVVSLGPAAQVANRRSDDIRHDRVLQRPWNPGHPADQGLVSLLVPAWHPVYCRICGPSAILDGTKQGWTHGAFGVGLCRGGAAEERRGTH